MYVIIIVGDDMKRIILHIDVNNAFLSWQALYLLKQGYQYDIRNRYAVIGGDETKRKGIVLAKSNLAKTKNIVTGETLYSARKKCPNLEVYGSNYEWYIKMSKCLFNILYHYTNEIEIFSVDECFLDYTNIKKRYGDEVKFAYKIKKEIYDKLGFTVNIGVANNKLCAKMASDFQKPNRVHTLYNEEVETKMFPLNVDDLFGIGKKTSVKLHNLNINTIKDLANANYETLYRIFKNQTKDIIDKANGINNDPVIYWNVEPKGIGNEITLTKDLVDKEEVYKYLYSIAEHLGIRIRKQEKYAYVIVVVIKDNKFKRYSHQKKLKNPTDITKIIYEEAKKIFDEMYNDVPIRLIGIRLDNLTTTQNRQLSLFENHNEIKNMSNLDKVVDKLKEKYGTNIIKTGFSNEDLFKKRLK